MVPLPNRPHPLGEANNSGKACSPKAIEVETFAGKVHVEWDATAAVTAIGQLAFLIESLKPGHRVKPWVDECPRHYASHTAPKKIHVLGSLFLSILSGRNRYTHMTALRGDSVDTRLPGMSKVVRDDSANRALKRMDVAKAIEWLQSHLRINSHRRQSVMVFAGARYAFLTTAGMGHRRDICGNRYMIAR